MGFQFNILCNKYLILEYSTFARFFTENEPIIYLHNALKLAHDADVALSPTDNRNILSNALRSGDAIFVVDHTESEPIYTLIKRSVDITTGGEVTRKLSRGYTETEWEGDLTVFSEPEERKFPGGEGTKVSGQTYQVFKFYKNKFIGKTIEPGNPIGVFNRLFPGRGNRDFYIIKNTDFLRTKTHPFVAGTTAKGEYSRIMPITKESIDRFVVSSLNYTKKLINKKIKEQIEEFKQRAIQDIEDISKSDDEFGRNISRSPIMEYRKMLRILSRGVHTIDTVKLFSEFMLQDPRVNLDEYDYLMNPGSDSGLTDIANPFSEPTPVVNNNIVNSKKISSNTAKALIKRQLNANYQLTSEPNELVLTRPKYNRKQITKQAMKSLRRSDSADEYEIFDKTTRQWIQYDPDYFGTYFSKHPYTKNNNFAAIAFKKQIPEKWDIGNKDKKPSFTSTYKQPLHTRKIAIPRQDQYREFVRKFISYVLRTWFKTTATREIDNLLSMI